MSPGPASSAEANRWLVLAVVCAALLVVVIDATVLHVAAPSISEDLRPSAVQLLWSEGEWTLGTLPLQSSGRDWDAAIDTVARTFTVRGYTLHYDDATVFQLHGATWNASLNTRIEAKAKLQTNGELLATEVETED